ncbi:MAG TPA: hypothetical protein VIL22_06700 [Paenibacillaceae bacterium]
MAQIIRTGDKAIRIKVTLEDAVAMIREAARHPEEYAHDIAVIYEKMPEFGYTHFCFYAYDSARLFERILDDDPKKYLSLTLDAPDAFFYALYGGMAGLYETMKQERKTDAPAEEAGSPAEGGVQA